MEESQTFHNMGMLPMYPVSIGVTNPLHVGLLAWWNLDEAAGNLIDSGPNALQLARVNTPSQAVGLLGNCTQFQRAGSDYLTLTTNILRLGQYTDWSTWCWFQAVDADPFNSIIGIGGAVDFEYMVYLINNGGGGVFYRAFVKTGGVFKTCPAVDPAINVITDNPWTALMMTYDGAAQELTLSYRLVGIHDTGWQSDMTPAVGTITPTALAFRVGAEDAAAQFLNGSVFGIGLWQRKLSSVDRDKLWNGGAAVKWPLV